MYPYLISAVMEHVIEEEDIVFGNHEECYPLFVWLGFESGCLLRLPEKFSACLGRGFLVAGLAFKFSLH